jgi:hypothetical protein
LCLPSEGGVLQRRLCQCPDQPEQLRRLRPGVRQRSELHGRRLRLHEYPAHSLHWKLRQHRHGSEQLRRLR